MENEFNNDPNFVAWGPFVPDWYRNEAITRGDVIIASTVYALTCLATVQAVWLAWGQTKASRVPLRSIYVWLIWTELVVSFLMGGECFLHLLKVIRPSFIFYFSILFFWCIQVQLLLQIIINRIRVIVPDRRRSKQIMIGTAIIVTIINISVFNIWIPARLQTSQRYILINKVWDRLEKVIYLVIDALLNWYFLKTVKSNLINNGLQKYNKLLRFNQRIIIVSLIMDVMIIVAMSIPNSFVYIQFHPLAYMVKLNIEMIMANLIKRIAISKSRRVGNASIIEEFNSTGDKSNSHNTGRHAQKSSYIELTAKVLPRMQRKESFTGTRTSVEDGKARDKTLSFLPSGNQIKKTEEITVRSEPNPDYDGAKHTMSDKEGGVVVNESQMLGGKSLDDVSEGGESVKTSMRRDSDDEAVLVRNESTYDWDRQ